MLQTFFHCLVLKYRTPFTVETTDHTVSHIVISTVKSGMEILTPGPR